MTDIELFQRVFEEKQRLKEENEQLKKHLDKVLNSFLVDMTTQAKRRTNAKEYLDNLKRRQT